MSSFVTIWILDFFKHLLPTVSSNVSSKQLKQLSGLIVQVLHKELHATHRPES